eukprot:gene20764-20689_t
MKALAWIGGLLATVAAVIIGSVLTVFAVTTVVVLAVMTSATLAFVALAGRASRKARARAADDGVIEAHKVGAALTLTIASRLRPHLVAGDYIEICLKEAVGDTLHEGFVVGLTGEFVLLE